ncbi:type VI secretion system ATPase TssH [bacterium]|nr:type VI secretion system ATPase TssH [bacterium]
MNTELEALIKKLNPVCHQAVQKAAEICVSNTNFNVELEHFILKLLENKETDVRVILNHYNIDPEKPMRQCSQTIDHLKRGNARTPAMSPQIVILLEEAWMIASMNFGENTIRSGAVIMGLLSNQTLRGVVLESIPSLLQIPFKNLGDNLRQILDQSQESGVVTSHNHFQMDDGKGFQTNTENGNTRVLDRFTVNLSKKAKAGEIDPVEGRDREIRQIIDILMRRRQNNPILTGDAGVGKTAIVEGFALRILSGDVPQTLRDVSIHVLDLGLMQAGAGVKGEFEQRLKDVINEVKSSPSPIILFVDEAHTLIGAGGQAGQNDAANLLKPALARGELRTIAATTWSEYKKYFEKDHALVRRFQVIKVEEPEPGQAIEMLRSVARSLENYHKVRIIDEAVVDAVKLSHRYISGRRLPDKAVSLLDTACARVAVGQDSTPAVIEDVIRRLKILEREIAIMKGENAVTGENGIKFQTLFEEKERNQKKLQLLEVRWEEEKKLLNKIKEMNAELVEKRGCDVENTEINLSLKHAREALKLVQDNAPMAHIEVDSDIVASIVSGWTGIPVGKMMTDEIKSILNLKEMMEKRLIGQSHALAAISRRIRTSRARLDDPGKPIGVFLLVGPSGVGKTETALTLSELLYGGEENVITVNMSEYQEAHTVSSLKGAPPGYVGFGTGGILTEAVRRQPFSVVLLDEVEKAHPDVMELFYQVFDKGTIEDGEGTRIDFKNTVILLTSNIGSDVIAELCLNRADPPDPDILVEQVRPQLLQHFKPALLGRLVVIPYYHLGKEQIEQIVTLKLEKIKKRFWEYNSALLEFNPILIDTVASRCTEVDSGARNIDNILTNHLLPELSTKILTRMAEGLAFEKVKVSLDEQGSFSYEVQ